MHEYKCDWKHLILNVVKVTITKLKQSWQWNTCIAYFCANTTGTNIFIPWPLYFHSLHSWDTDLWSLVYSVYMWRLGCNQIYLTHWLMGQNYTYFDVMQENTNKNNDWTQMLVQINWSIRFLNVTIFTSNLTL